MDRNTMRATAREQLKGFCRVCPVCDGRACAGEVPGMGGVGTAGAFKANMDALARVKLNLRTIHAVKEPDMSLTLWGRTLAMPILVAPITGSTYNMGGTMTEEAFIAEMVRAFKTRHDYVLGALNGIRGVRCLPAQGAFYLFPDTRDAMRATGASDDVAFADLLLREAGVALVPGSAFGAPGFQRISIATSLANLEKAMERITAFLGPA